MAKLPEPNLGKLKALTPAVVELPTGTPLARIYFAGGMHPTAWNALRHFGPLARARFDHHDVDESGLPFEQQRGIAYLAPLAVTCLAEVFQATRAIDRSAGDPALAVFDCARALKLLDLAGVFATRMGASLAIHSGPRNRTRAWAHALYEAYPDLDGIRYLSSMRPGTSAVALFERGSDAFPPFPRFNRLLIDPTLTNLIDACALEIGYLRV